MCRRVLCVGDRSGGWRIAPGRRSRSYWSSWCRYSCSRSSCSDTISATRSVSSRRSWSSRRGGPCAPTGLSRCSGARSRSPWRSVQPSPAARRGSAPRALTLSLRYSLGEELGWVNGTLPTEKRSFRTGKFRNCLYLVYAKVSLGL